MNQYIDALKTFVSTFAKKHRLWVELSAYVILATGTAFWVGRDAYVEAATLRTEGQRLDALRKSADHWISSFQPATSVETQQWQQVSSAVHQLGSNKDSRITLLEIITRRAERSGLAGVRVTIASTDSTPAIPRLSAEPTTFVVADYTIIVEFRGNLAATRAFLANLPPAVGVQRINMSRSGSTMGTRMVLTVYEAVANAPI